MHEPFVHPDLLIVIYSMFAYSSIFLQKKGPTQTMWTSERDLTLLITPPYSPHLMTLSLKIVFCGSAGHKWPLSVSLFQHATVSDSAVPPVCRRYNGWQQPPCVFVFVRFFFFFFDICGFANNSSVRRNCTEETLNTTTTRTSRGQKVIQW